MKDSKEYKNNLIYGVIFMKKTILIILTMMVVFTMLLSTNSMVYATENLDYSPYTAIAQTSEAIPRWTNCNQCSFVFNVLDPGEAHINVSYVAESSVFVQAKSTVKIQKKFWGLFWTTVDIGTTNDEWIEYCTDVYGDLYNYFPVDGTGTYRAVFKLEITGTDGSVDVIEDTIEYKYS